MLDRLTEQESRIRVLLSSIAQQTLYLAAEALLEEKSAKAALQWLQLRKVIRAVRIERGGVHGEFAVMPTLYDDTNEVLFQAFYSLRDRLTEFAEVLRDAAASALSDNDPRWQTAQGRLTLAFNVEPDEAAIAQALEWLERASEVWTVAKTVGEMIGFEIDGPGEQDEQE